jgi:hypothetical protein
LTQPDTSGFDSTSAINPSAESRDSVTATSVGCLCHRLKSCLRHNVELVSAA